MQNHSFEGSIEIIFGPMFSGKTTELLRKVNRYKYAQKKCLVLSYAKDVRYSDAAVISTHDKYVLFIFAAKLISRQMMKAIKCMNVSEAMPISQNYDVIAIDEGQFFSDVNLSILF